MESFHVKGQYVPFGDFHTTPGRSCALLAGDAAGFVDPITGEGIAYAMQSGQTAAKSVIEAMSLNAPSCAVAIYHRKVAQILNDLESANLWKWLIFPTAIKGLFNWGFADASTLQKGYFDILAGNLSYNDLPRLFRTQIAKGVRKLAFRTERNTC